MGFKAEIIGNALDLQALESSFGAGEPRITFEGGRYWLESSSFADLADDQVGDAARDLVDQLNGAMRIKSPRFQPVQASSHFKDADRVHTVVLAETITLRTRVGAVIVSADGQPDPVPPPSPEPRWAELAGTDADVRDLLRLMGSAALDWAVMWKAYGLFALNWGP